MGGAQSTANGASSSSTSATGPTRKTSYYDLLELPKTATEEEIKKAYRRKALTLHPDRNYGQEETATALFAEIQAAYEVLSDAQERAWYDAHEDAILRDVDPYEASGAGATPSTSTSSYERNVGITSSDDIARLFRRFNSKVEFDDSETGFFGFLKGVFAQLVREEEAAIRMAGGQDFDGVGYPSFGGEGSSDAEVKRFYGAWTAFATRKSFAWRDRYRTVDAENRWVRRQMEKENKRFRDEGMQEFNESVRALVAFVKKRDPRYKPDTRSEAERQAALRDAAAAQARRMKERNEEMMKEGVADWAQSRTDGVEADQLDELEGEIDDSESEDEQWECVACRKTFKSEQQMQAHERSKKHIKAVQQLRRKMKKEGLLFEVEQQDTPVDSHALQDESDAATLSDEPVSIGEDVSNGALGHQSAEDDESVNQEISKLQLDGVDGDDDDDDDDGDAKAIKVARDHNSSTHDESPNESDSEMLAADEGMDDQKPSIPKQGRAAQKRAKKAAKQASADVSESTHSCSGCNGSFTSKTKLFQHLKDHPGHAALRTSTGGGGGKGKKRRK